MWSGIYNLCKNIMYIIRKSGQKREMKVCSSKGVVILYIYNIIWNGLGQIKP